MQKWRLLKQRSCAKQLLQPKPAYLLVARPNDIYWLVRRFEATGAPVAHLQPNTYTTTDKGGAGNLDLPRTMCSSRIDLWVGVYFWGGCQSRTTSRARRYLLNILPGQNVTPIFSFGGGGAWLHNTNAWAEEQEQEMFALCRQHVE